MRILHVTRHLGGGLGTVILDWAAYSKNGHTIACLDYANDKAKRMCKEKAVFLSANLSQNEELLYTLIRQADIVVFHWYDHPALRSFLYKEIPSCRLVFWCHKNYEFNIREKKYPDYFINTSIVQETNDGCISSTGNMQRFLEIEPKKHRGFNIGYIGTVDYKKMHSRFKYICDSIQIPNVHFTIIGENKTNYKSNDKFDFIGQVNDIAPYLSRMDLFGYLLRSDHYGTCEQVLGEAMCAGVVPIALNNPAERQIIRSGYSGILAENEKKYKQYIELLARSPFIMKALSDNARSHARTIYSIKHTAEQWASVFKKMMQQTKHAGRVIEI